VTAGAGVGADPARLRAHVAALEGPRHRHTAPEALRAAEDYVAQALDALGLVVHREPFELGGAEYRNVVGVKTGSAVEQPRVLVGAHYDTVSDTRGADDNASGVAALLETARLVAREPLAATVEFVGFNLEEPQGLRYRVGSDAYAAAARRRGVRYAGALILEMVGYADPRPGSQRVPALLFWKRVPRTGTFLAATGDGRSGRLLYEFAAAARTAVPDLPLVTFRSPLRGWLVVDTRLSDNASFWDQGYPALMLTDTAFLRNPHYHTPGDAIETLDFAFMTRVATAVAAAVQRLAGPEGESPA
jgi:Zn-dependent M28 family amino/carboxypeptidase